MTSLTVYGALAFETATSVASRRAQLLVLISAIVLVLAIGFSRVYLGVHYASDVVAAYGAGLAWLTLCALTLLAASRLRTGKHRPRTLPTRSQRTAYPGKVGTEARASRTKRAQGCAFVAAGEADRRSGALARWAAGVALSAAGRAASLRMEE